MKGSSSRIKMWNTVSSLVLVLVLAGLESVNSASTQSSTRTYLNESTVKPTKASSASPANRKTIIYGNEDCTLVTNSQSGLQKLDEYLHNEDVKLIRYIFTIDNTTTPLNMTSIKQYRPMIWTRTFSAQGLGVLQLGDMYSVYSFRLLDIGIETLEINLSQQPADCLQGKSAEDFEQMLRLAVLSELQTPSLASDGDFKVFNDSQNICNQHALTDQGMLNVSYYCCTLDKDKQLVCRYLTFTTVWMKVIFWAAMILPAIVVLFLPNYLPKSMLVSKTGVASFTYRLSGFKILRVTRIESIDQIDRGQAHEIIDIDRIKHMEQFFEKVSVLAVNTTSSLYLQDIRFLVPNECVLTKEDMGLYNVFRRMIFNCGVRNTKWYRLLKVLVKLLFAVLVFAPVLVRVAVFYVFEYDEASALEESAKEHSEVVVIQNGLTVNIPPFHPDTPDWDSLLEDPYFKATVNSVLDSYKESWHIDDISVVDHPPPNDNDVLIPITGTKPDTNATLLYILDIENPDITDRNSENGSVKCTCCESRVLLQMPPIGIFLKDIKKEFKDKLQR
ncbi:uncharacterized protein LOC128202802 [Mya arenaria]|uniref:uncharacterized protein LOC128202802 n=1 Tax=Mya arenaria TaxID=6604 RepID=UPI0022E630C8|nr:uncharacterized protein LOC128202802 [Mya arenaria]